MLRNAFGSSDNLNQSRAYLNIRALAAETNFSLVRVAKFRTR